MRRAILYDISPPLTPSLAVWPGDTPLSREVLMDMRPPKCDNITLSTLRGTAHLGAHADGPNHYGADAPGIDQRDLDYYLGSCQVMHVNVERGSRVERRDLPFDVRAKRVLIATNTYPDPNHFSEDFAGLSPQLVDFMHTRGVKLIGIDTPSVDLFSSKDLPAHKRFLANDMAILEGLILSGVPDGVYELIALPLKLVGFDASPVRAVLRTI
jgi:arylformamidase